MSNENQILPDAFISHVEEDADIALEVAHALESAGYSTWYYERDSLPGVSYLVQTGDAIEHARSVVLIVSVHSLGSNQVSSEVVRAHEAGKPFIPVLCNVTHSQFQSRQPMWRQAVGSAASVAVPSEGLEAITPRIIAGLKGLGVLPGGSAEKAKETAPAEPTTVRQPIKQRIGGAPTKYSRDEPAPNRSRDGTLRWPQLALVAIAIQAIVIVWLVYRTGTISRKESQAGTALAATLTPVPPTRLPTRQPDASPTRPPGTVVATEVIPEAKAAPTTPMSTRPPAVAEGISVPGAMVAEFFSPGPRPGGIAVVGDTIWLADDQQRILYKLDRSGNVQESLPMTPAGTMRGMAWDGKTLLLALASYQRNQVVRLDQVGTVIESITLPVEPFGIGWDEADGAFWVAAAESNGSFLLKVGASGRVSEIVRVQVHGSVRGLTCAPDGFYLASIFGTWHRFSYVGEDMQSASLVIKDTFPSDLGLFWDREGYLWVSVTEKHKFYQLALTEAKPHPTPTVVSGQGQPKVLPRPSMQLLETEDKAVVSVTNALSGRLTISVDSVSGGDQHESSSIEPGQTWSVRVAPGVYTIFASTNVPRPLGFQSDELLIMGYEHVWTLTAPE